MEERYQNRLIHEKSPYLLQHAHNPVNWYPWGKEAFEAAKSTGKPIFLSIGYSTCHWCHVMEKESFQNPEIAIRLNEEFICIKVDREEHPDVDAVYMSFAQALMSTGAGWPLNVLLTPDLKPFFALTYVPPENSKGAMGLKELIDHISKIWKSEERELIFEQADKIVEIFESSIQTCGDNLPTKEDFLDSLEALFEISDPINGGFRGAPKFPMGYLYSLFLHYGKSYKESRALFLTEMSLNKMHQGGIYDHVGGGFSRYAVDEKWQVPHFEKMLSDNVLLCNVFLEAAQCFPNVSVYKETAQEILEYFFTEMRHPEGCFYSAQDADVGGEEGVFYTWTKEEIEQVLSPEESKIFCAYFNVAPGGNFKGRNILSAHLSYDEFIEQIKIPLAKPFESMKELLIESKKKLKEKRQLRPQPFKDDKIITSWNGLMIDCLLKASVVLQEKKYLEAATAAAEFIYKHLWVNNTLMRRYREGDARFKGSLEDYAFLIKGLITLFEAGSDVKWLVWASELCKLLEKHFKAQGGAFFSTEPESGLILRNCIFYDGAEPSGNAIHAENLLRLFQITQEPACLAQAEDILKAAKSFIKEYPQASCYHLRVLARLHDPKAYTMVVALDESSSLKSEIEALLSTYFVPHLSTIWKKQGDILLEEILPNVKDKVPLDGQTAVYFCSRSGCQAPLIRLEEIEKMIANI